ncbi:hypothetical protein EV356DRAFT_448431 [Viridothelium virens]|uniref:Zn(2)-C6 fungal-type domain-containing protein n=1 Tax=Viridothelium virens TaxID=1048519 RepID=A0A6A6H600_VIRVR|nr:hypothetical protein EV356DRAFT_448431 [Viridothelium virens]
MDLSNLLTSDSSRYRPQGQVGSHQYPTRNTTASIERSQEQQQELNGFARQFPSIDSGGQTTPHKMSSAAGLPPKNVSFKLILPEAPQQLHRLPMRVSIFPHDATESIITTVKNFYALLQGVSFEDEKGNTLIARYENFTADMTVYVRAVNFPAAQSPVSGQYVQDAPSPIKPRLDAPFEMRPPQLNTAMSPTRSASRAARGRSISPQSAHSRYSASALSTGKGRPRKQRNPGSFVEGMNDEDSLDGSNESVTSSRRGKSDQLASAEISVNNIVEGGRRQRAKFESSELPLFVPPQAPMTGSISSASPQRRIGSHNGASPSFFSNQQTFSYIQPLPSPQSHGQGDNGYAGVVSSVTPHPSSSSVQHGHQLRTRGTVPYPPARQSVGGILPTPDPTIGSAISDEDVALQLMRLGDPSNVSHGRTSTSTVDDALSGKAELASSDEESDGGSDGEHDLPPNSYQYPASMGNFSDVSASSGEEYEDGRDDSFKGSDGILPEGSSNPHAQKKISKPKAGGVHTKSRIPSMSKNIKPQKQRQASASSHQGRPRLPSVSAAKAPISPSSLPPPSRKTSNASTTLTFQSHTLNAGEEEEDLSTKPRCQRCRKSKKGCDRQRPCQRCKDAGIGIEGCVSEDEGNGRKGRYGRHMGVPITAKRGASEMEASSTIMQTPGLMAAPTMPVNKKRKK